jgi:Ca-activated chloride channel family protein
MLVVVGALVAGWMWQQKNAPVPGTAGVLATEPKDDAANLELFFTYGSEKVDWVKEVTQEFNNQDRRTTSGRKVTVTGFPMGSGECMAEVLDQTRKVHLTSPASGAFLTLANHDARAKGQQPVVAKTRNLVLSPVVLALWKPMARALGWGTRPIGWADVHDLALQPQGWAKYDHPQWGRFKLGHTHPEHSNSGLVAVLAEVYAANGKTDDLTLADVRSDKTAQYLAAIEKSVVHYGSSTGFFGKKMFQNGPAYLSCAVLYESMVVESYDKSKYDLPFPVVCVYPREGTFWADHPIGIVERPWVSAEHREAAQQYIDFLLTHEQQERAMKFGFRPGLESIPLAAPLDAEHGVDPKEPRRGLAVPTAEVIRAGIDAWKANKKPSQVVLVIDTSGSMEMDGRLVNARAGARQFVSLLGDNDHLSLISFSNTLTWLARDVPVGKERGKIEGLIDSLVATGGTALYDAVAEGHQYLQSNARPDTITAVVVLTDGEDNMSKRPLPALLQAVKIDPERRPTRVFCIAYGQEANFKVLQGISDATEAKAYQGDPRNIRAVFADIGTFF